MIRKPNHIQHGEVLITNICIVGGGPAAITVALQLIGTGKKVLMLTGGRWNETVANRELNRGLAYPANSHEPLQENRRRQFGGASAAWGGRCVPMDPIDFTERPWIRDSGWPITYEALLPYYVKANYICDAGEYEYDANKVYPGRQNEIIEGMDDHELVSWPLERWSPPINFAKRFKNELNDSPEIDVLLDAHVVKLNCEASAGKISNVSVVFEGKTFSVVADIVVLAAGGIENPRLLLSSKNEFHPRGIGNQNDLVGRYYMAHLNGTFAELAPIDRQRIGFDYEKDKDGVFVRRRWWITEKTQVEKEIGNVIMFLNHTYSDDGHCDALFSWVYIAKSSLEILKKKSVSKMFRAYQELKPGVGNHVKNAFNGGLGVMPKVVKLVVHRFYKRRLPSILPSVNSKYLGLYFQSEHMPNYHSRVTISNSQTDANGVPLPVVKVAFCEQDYKTVIRAHQIFMRQYFALQAGDAQYDEAAIFHYLKKRTANFNSAAHHMGTTRMSDSASKGVVDADCKVHGIENLYITGSSVFPTGGHVNPTLTLVALAIRLGDHLKEI